MLLSAAKNGAKKGVKNGSNGNGLRKIRDIPNYRDSQEFKVLNDRLRQHQWTVDENKYLNLDTDDQIQLHQEITYHAGTVTTKGNLWYPDQPWMKDVKSLGKVNKKGKPSHVKAKQSFKKIKDPSEIGYNDDKRYKGTQDKQAADRAFNLEEGTTGYDEVHARLTELKPLLQEAIPNYNELDMFLELKNTNKRQVKDRLDLIKQWNKDLKNYEGVTDKEQFYTAGHASSRAKGGPATASNFGFPETGAQNYKTQNKEDLPKWVLEEIGVDTSWTMWVDRYVSDKYGLGLIKQTDAQRFLTDFDKLDILNRKVDWTTALQARIDDLNNAY